MIALARAKGSSRSAYYLKNPFEFEKSLQLQCVASMYHKKTILGSIALLNFVKR
jgi:hypothetical protein